MHSFANLHQPRALPELPHDKSEGTDPRGQVSTREKTDTYRSIHGHLRQENMCFLLYRASPNTPDSTFGRYPISAAYINVSLTEYNGSMKHSAWNTCQQSLAFLKSSMQSLAFSPNCHLHCVFASYSSPGSFSGYLYSFTGFGRSARQVAWAVLEHRGAAAEARA